jgi:hydrogenase nickel incorporation protein HypA/HybF
MHELSVALSIVEAVEEEAERHHGHLEAVHLRLGPLAGVIKEALLSAWDLACEGSSLNGVRLVVEEVPILIYCPKCQSNQPATSMQWLCCAQCDTPAGEVVQGRELELRALEIRDGE